MRSLEITRSGVLGTLAVLIVAGVCIRLGFWQLDRRAERQIRNRAVAERMADTRARLASARWDTAGLTYRRVRFAGDVDDDRAVVLAGRSRHGAPGVHLLSPFRLQDGAILVNRGWLPAPDGATAELGPARLEGRYRIEGVLVPFPDVDLDTEVDGFRTRWFRVDGDAIRGQYPYSVAPLYLQATSAPTLGGPPGGAEDVAGMPVPLDPPTVDPGPHLSYAVQWFSFAGVFLIGWVVLLLRRSGPVGSPSDRS